MPRILSNRRAPRHHPMPHRPARRRDQTGSPPLRTSDLMLALLGVALLGGLVLVAAFTRAGGATAP